MTDSIASPKSAPLDLGRLIQSKVIEERDAASYRQLIKDHYNGPAGWFTLVTGFYTGHESLADSVLSPSAFDVAGCKRILDAGCGNGRYLRFLVKQADEDALLVGCDLSEGMLRRAAKRVKGRPPELLMADLTRLPYSDGAFDAVVCGWVFEHLLDPMAGMCELARITAPGGKILLMTTEATLFGAFVSRAYHCRTTRRKDLRQLAEQCQLTWHREYWFSKLHKAVRVGGIVVELRKTAT